MTAKTKDEIKAFFNTGDKPTEAQFIDFIDSYVDKSGPLGTLEAAASAAGTGLAAFAAGTPSIAGYSTVRTSMGIEVYTSAQSNTVALAAISSQIAAGVFAGGLIDIQVITSSGTWTKPSGATKVEVTVVGGGGGGGGSTGNGGTGGTSSFGPHCSATGGAGGTGALATVPEDAPIGGIGSGGDANIRGGAGGNPQGGITSGFVPGSGGNSILGGGAAAKYTQDNGVTGGTYGGGGAGAKKTTAGDAAGQGGAGGGAAIKYITSGLGTTETITIGAGGTAGSGTYTGGVGGAGVIIVKSY